MGCLLSSARDASPLRRAGSIGEVAVYVPGFRIPQSVDFYQTLGDSLSKSLLDRLSALRANVVAMAASEARQFTKPERRAAIKHGAFCALLISLQRRRNALICSVGVYIGSTSSELLGALENYLPLILGLVKDGCHLRDKVQFIWINQEDDAKETAIANAWYEVLSVLHLMAMLCLWQANLLLLPKKSREGYQLKLSDAESRRSSIDVLLKAAGYLDCAIRHVLPQIPPELRKGLPLDLEEEVLQALCLQALGQCVDIQLGMAIDSAKPTLAVKRRLACEMANYWNQAENNITKLNPFTDGWAKKHQLFVKWKCAEAKAAAYYYHGLILDEGNTEKSHGMAIAALQASEELLKESKKACEVFHAMPPTSRNPPRWGSMKYLNDKIPKAASSKIQINQDLYNKERTLVSLPDFALALKPDDYQLPPLDPLWGKEDYHVKKLATERKEID
ncbi:hypothetical protein Cni_G18580 [Canna indica]|uniref:BRO1 domain-containing protein n=1 Tax=Canna indica TaxID=4628 RepID=A0AAQ3KPK1_9LILI|nr:hypothetical protein Cni_G18580 [Canna indica]